jgi:thiamine pyrophosphokinase
MGYKRTDGRAIDVVSAVNLEKGTPVYLQGFHGFTMDRVVASIDQAVAIDVAEQVWEFAVPAGLTAPKGTTLYISTNGAHTITTTAGAGYVAFAKVVEAKDANNIVWAKQLPQVA